MEKQKVFWVVLSVSVFVVVVLVVGVFLLKPKPASTMASTPGAISPISDAGTNVYEYSTPAEKPQEKQGDTETMHFYIGDGEEPAQEKAPEQAQAQEPVQPEPRPPHGEQPAAAPQKAAPVKSTATVKAARKVIEYWIQTGSFGSQTKAEEMVALLSAKGITGRMFTHTDAQGTCYRVRIGPYLNQGEARKFLEVVKQVEGAQASYISQVSARRAAN